jgi:hypothetical protein
VDLAGPQLPHDELAADIARHLEDAGEYRITLVPSDPQRLVDLRWAALAAGRLMGRRVHVAATRAAVDYGRTPITVRVTTEPTSQPAIPLQREQVT